MSGSSQLMVNGALGDLGHSVPKNATVERNAVTDSATARLLDLVVEFARESILWSAFAIWTLVV